MPFGLLISIICHSALLFWALFAARAEQLPTPDTPAISAEIITPSEFLRLKQGSEDAKKLETKLNDKLTVDESKNDTKKPDNPLPAPPPPSPEEAKLETPPPEPPKSEPPPEPSKAEPPPPEPTPGPTPDEQKLLEQKIEEQRKADEEAKKKAEEEAARKAEEARKKKLAEDARKKKLAEEARKKAEREKKKFDEKKLADLLNKLPDDSTPKALIDKDPTKKGQQASGSSRTAAATGQEAGTKTGADTVLSAREQDLLKGMIKSQLAQCWRLPGAGGGSDVPVVTLMWKLRPDGSLDGEPLVQRAPSDVLGQAAADAALRAVRSCQPFKLPPESYDGWKDIEWTFDPREML